LYNSCSSTSH